MATGAGILNVRETGRPVRCKGVLGGALCVHAPVDLAYRQSPLKQCPISISHGMGRSTSRPTAAAAIPDVADTCAFRTATRVVIAVEGAAEAVAAAAWLLGDAAEVAAADGGATVALPTLAASRRAG